MAKIKENKKERKPRQKKIVMVKSSVMSSVEDAKSEVEELKDELQSWFDNLPEQFQNGDKGNELEEAINQLDEVSSQLDSIDFGDYEDEEIEYSLLHHKATSRAKRLDNAMAGVIAAIDKMQERVDAMNEAEKDGIDENAADLESIISDLQSADDAAGSVEFPGMY